MIIKILFWRLEPLLFLPFFSPIFLKDASNSPEFCVKMDCFNTLFFFVSGGEFITKADMYSTCESSKAFLFYFLVRFEFLKYTSSSIYSEIARNMLHYCYYQYELTKFTTYIVYCNRHHIR